jgi:hypothetical protein
MFPHLYEYLTFRGEIYDTRSWARDQRMDAGYRVFDYSFCSKHKCKACFSEGNNVKNERVHRAIFRYMFAKNKTVCEVMEGGDHAVSEHVNVILFDYLLGGGERLQSLSGQLKSNSIETVTYVPSCTRAFDM